MNHLSVLRPKRPKGNAWLLIGKDSKTGYATRQYKHKRSGLVVVSALEAPEGVASYHVSVSAAGYTRCSAEQLEAVRAAFDMRAAEEDNHSPIIRSLWLPVEEKLQGSVCDCKAGEAKIVVDDFEYRPLIKSRAVYD